MWLFFLIENVEYRIIFEDFFKVNFFLVSFRKRIFFFFSGIYNYDKKMFFSIIIILVISFLFFFFMYFRFHS